MNKLLLSLSTVLIGITISTSAVKAQNPYEDVLYPYANDSLVYEEYEQGAWAISGRQKYVLYPDRRPDLVRFYQGNTSTMYVFDYLWDANNKLLGYDLKFNFGGQNINVTELRLIRNPQGNVIEEISQELDQPGAPLVNNERTLYKYDAQNRLIEELSQDWDNNVSPAVWANTKKSIYSYDANGKRAIQIDSFWVNTNNFIFGSKLEYNYDVNGKLATQLRKNEQNTETGKSTYTYNTAGFLTEEKYETKDGSNYSLNRKDSIILDANNRITQEFEYSFDFMVNKVLMTGRMNAQGSSVGIFSESKLLKKLNAFPNPTSGAVTLKLSGESEKNVEVYNLLGEKVMSLTLQSTNKTIDLSSLSNGIYTIKVNSKDGDFQNKVILNK